MGIDIAEDAEALPSPHNIKVHRPMCTELIKLVKRVSEILPEIEAAQPRCSSGMDALCLLTNANDEAKSLLQDCSLSSKLYLAFKGDVILSRCKKLSNLLERSLSQIQKLVPVLLAAEVSGVIADLGGATFSLDPRDNAVGNVFRELLHQYASASDSVEEIALQAIRVAALRLHITSQRAMLVEKRSIKRLLGKLKEGEPPAKRKILLLFWNLLNKYGKVIIEEQKRNGSIWKEDQFSYYNSRVQSADVESGPPDEYKCPLSLRLMYDPVVIASGKTFERMWIQKWFDEGHDTCPKTRMKLAHLSVTPNTNMKDLISKWCEAHGVTISNPNVQSTLHSLDSSTTSIASLSSSMNDLSLPIDFSNLSLGSLDTSQTSETAQAQTTYGVNKMLTGADDDSVISHPGANAHDKDIEYLYKLDSLSWESQFSVVENIERLFKRDDQDWEFIPYQDLIPPLIRFLKHAHDLHDVKAQKTGCLLWLAFIKKCRKCIPCINDDAYGLLASFFDTEVAKEAFAILKALSCHERGRYKIAASGALIPLLMILDSQTRESHELVLKILCNLSEDSEVCSLLVSSGIIPKLVPLFEDSGLARYCVTILRNMSNKEDARASVAETDGCIAFLAKLLDSDSLEDQEHAVAVLFSLCSQHIQYPQLVMDEGVIPGLVSVSINGNDKAKPMAKELLCILKVEFNDNGDCSGSDHAISMQSSNTPKERKSSSKASRLFRKLSIF